MTVKEFLKALEDIKRTHGYNHFDLYAKNDGDYAQFFLGKYDPLIVGDYGTSIEPKSRNEVIFHSRVFDSDFEEIYDTVEQFKKSIRQNKISDNAVIKLYLQGDTIWEPDGGYEGGYFDIIKVVPAKRKNTVVLVVDELGTAPQLKTYEIEYSVWEENKYSLEIEAFSKEEAEAKFYETYSGEGKPYRKDEEIIAIREK